MARAVFQVFKQWSTCITFIGFCHNSYYSLLGLKNINTGITSEYEILLCMPMNEQIQKCCK